MVERAGSIYTGDKRVETFCPDAVKTRIRKGRTDVNFQAEVVGRPIFSPLHNPWNDELNINDPGVFEANHPVTIASFVDLPLCRKYLQGRRIINLGAGKTELGVFARRDGAVWFDLDPNYQYEPEQQGKIAAPKNSAAVVGLGEKLPFKTGEADEVLMTYLLDLVDNPRKIVEEAIRVCSSKGKLRIYAVLAFKNLEEIKRPEGIYFLRRGLDDFGVVIELEEVQSKTTLLDFLFDREKFCISPSREEYQGKNDWRRRLDGYYYNSAFDSEKSWWLGDVIK